MGKTYIVFVGRQPGVYDTWEHASAHVNGFRNHVHRSFSTREEAEAAFADYQKDHQIGSSSCSSSVCDEKTKQDTSTIAGPSAYSVEKPNETNHPPSQESRDQLIEERDQARKELAELRAKIRSLAFE